MWNDNIKNLREDHDLTQKDLASKLNIHVKTLYRYETGDSEPSLSEIIALAKIFNVSTDYICGLSTLKRSDTAAIKSDLKNLTMYVKRIIDSI